jgi:glutathione S-transferase
VYKFSRWVPHDRSGKVCWLLNELNVQFEIENLEYKTAHDDPGYRQLHPLGQVPALQDLRNGVSLFESGAICLYLADQHPEGGLIPDGKRAACYQWLLYNYATMEPAIEGYWKIADTDPELTTKKELLDVEIAKVLTPIEATLDRTEFIAGNSFSLADIPLAQSIFWLRNRPVLARFPRTVAYLEKLKSRPAAQRAGLFADQE